jgi:hypothetical protein
MDHCRIHIVNRTGVEKQGLDALVEIIFGQSQLPAEEIADTATGAYRHDYAFFEKWKKKQYAGFFKL